jgi:hypothetical protein
VADAELERWLAKQAISEVIHRYCRAVDRMDRSLAASCWHPGATADYRGLFEGAVEGLLDWMWRQHAALRGHSHQVTNILIETRGDRAVSESYVTATLRRERSPGELVDMVFLGRYLDRWSQREGTWAIDQRIFLGDLSHEIPVSPEFAGSGAGRRDSGDPSHTLFSAARRSP